MKALRSLIVFAALMAANPPAAPAQETAAAVAIDTLRLSIDDAVRHALEHGGDMKLANSEVRIADGRIKEAFADALPQLNGAAYYTRQFDSVFRGAVDDTIFGPLLENSAFAAVNRWNVDVQASQLLFSRKVGAGVAAAKSYRRITQAQRAETVADVTLRVRQQYLIAAAAGQLRAIAEFGLEQARSHFQQVERFRKQGTRAEYDLIQANVEMRNAEPPVVSARNDEALALLDLKRWMGVPLDRPVVLTTPVPFDTDAVPVTDLASLAPERRPELAAAEADVDGRKRLLDVERAERWPELRATGTVSHQAFPDRGVPETGEFRRNIEGTVRLDLPLFLGLRTSGTIARAQAELRQAEVRRDELKRSIELEQARARQEVERTLADFLARRGTVQLAQRAHHLATVRYNNGLSTALEVADARLQMLTAGGAEVRAARDYRIALAQLERALSRTIPLTPRALEPLSMTTPDPAPPATAGESGTRTRP